MTGSSPPQNKQMYHPNFVYAAWRCFPAKGAVLKSFTWYSQSNFSQATWPVLRRKASKIIGKSIGGKPGCEPPESSSERIQPPKKNKNVLM